MNEEPPPPEPLGSDIPSAPIRPSRRRTGRSIVRDLALVAVAFVATLILLGGIASLVGRSNPRMVGALPSAGQASPVGVPTQPAESPPTPSSDAPSAPTVSVSPSSDPVLVGAGDIADCALDADSATAALLDGIPGTVFTAGDNVYPDGSPDQFRDCYAPTWGRHLARTRPAAGNHDWVTDDLAGYFGYFGAAAAPAGKGWYSYDLGTWHVIVLDSDCTSVGGCGPDSAQGAWLASDLAAATARCTLAIWHHPRFSSGEHGDDPATAPFWRALYDADAEVVVNGHDHDYERFATQGPDGRGDGTRGLREFVVGTGGAALRTFPKPVANSQLRLADDHGVIRFVLHETSYDWSFLATSGKTLDSGTGACHWTYRVGS